jgi:hypothetical protein
MNFYMSVITDQLASHKGPDAQIVKINKESQKEFLNSLPGHIGLKVNTIRGYQIRQIISWGLYATFIEQTIADTGPCPVLPSSPAHTSPECFTKDKMLERNGTDS